MDATTRWTAEEVNDAIRQQRLLEFSVPGLRGRIESVRPAESGSNWLVVKTTFPGTAFLAGNQILTPPPSSLEGRRVHTPYGPGRVRSLRRGQHRFDYEVELTHAPLANGKFAVAYLGLGDVKGFVFEEIHADAEAAKNRGNELLKAKAWGGALRAYDAAVSVLREAVSLRQTPQQRKLMLDTVVKSISNKIHALLSLPEPDFRSALDASEEALMIDALCGDVMREKIMARRGTAQMGLSLWDDAVKTLSDPCLAGNAAAKANLSKAVAEVRQGKAREAELARAMFQGSAKKKSAAGQSPSPKPKAKQQAAAAVSTAKTPSDVAAPDAAKAAAAKEDGGESSASGGLSTALVAGLAIGALAVAAAAVYYFSGSRTSLSGAGKPAAAAATKAAAGAVAVAGASAAQAISKRR